MSAPIGNDFWKLRSRHGALPVFDGPEKLKEACEDYFTWVQANPLYEDKIGFYEGASVHTDAYKMQAMTLAGLCLFIDISIDAWENWRRDRKDLLGVIAWAETVIKHQKFIGAAAGLLNPVIISRDLGLGETHNIQARDKNGEKADMVPVSAQYIDMIDEAIAVVEKKDG